MGIVNANTKTADSMKTVNDSGVFIEEFDTIFDVIPHPVVIRDTREVIVRANEAAQEWFGFDP